VSLWYTLTLVHFQTLPNTQKHSKEMSWDLTDVISGPGKTTSFHIAPITVWPLLTASESEK